MVHKYIKQLNMEHGKHRVVAIKSVYPDDFV